MHVLYISFFYIRRCVMKIKCEKRNQCNECSNTKHDNKKLLKIFQDEVTHCYDIANRLDSMNPHIKNAFIGTPSERIVRQLQALCIFESDTE